MVNRGSALSRAPVRRNLPFSFPNGKATQDAAGIKIVYSGTVCGIPVSGDEVLQRQ
ncbi:MAG: hypothetical protein ABI818_12600 [Acidobacteriota bacterium]